MWDLYNGIREGSSWGQDDAYHWRGRKAVLGVVLLLTLSSLSEPSPPAAARLHRSQPDPSHIPRCISLAYPKLHHLRDLCNPCFKSSPDLDGRATCQLHRSLSKSLTDPTLQIPCISRTTPPSGSVQPAFQKFSRFGYECKVGSGRDLDRSCLTAQEVLETTHSRHP